MKQCFLRVSAMLAGMCLASTAYAEDLMVKIQGVQSNDGTINVALFNSGSGFPDGAKASHHRKISASKGTLTVSFTGLASGSYAVALFHDENGNGALDNNMLGIPKEGIGFSKNIKPRFGPPDFAETSFSISGGTTSQSISLLY